MMRPARARFAAALAMGVAAGLATMTPSGPARAAEPFSEEAIHAEIVRLAGPLWRLESLTMETLTVPGRDSGQRAAARIAARMTLAVPTFVVDSREGAVTFLRPAAETGLEKTLTAIALAARSGAGWTVKIEPQNPEILDGVGKPAAELPGRTVLAGSEEARSLREQLDREAQQRLADETARRTRAEELLAQQAATAKAEVERAERGRAAVDARATQIADLRAKLLGPDRPARIAAYEAALGGNDAALRQLAIEAALQSRDPVLANLALKDWIARRRAVPVQIFATKEDPSSEAVVQNLGPMTLEIEGFNPADGAVAGRLGAPGYSIAKPSSIIGTLAQTELALNSYGCALTLRLTEHRTLDGLLRCQTLPTLIARITLD
ncbi:hypothetical protein [Azospirillum doebereinerae]|uniref:HlyD family secretion protein n=1 Tax=Azospirillum doebereinerae TaxID=92933 RepID=A0A433JBW5_9PROT|nr:hypothetical protein [Azospirillum doebereinerae]RUQ74053.1 hypothetical protein EJ913_06700 [Azospirillum doebereinerae]